MRKANIVAPAIGIAVGVFAVFGITLLSKQLKANKRVQEIEADLIGGVLNIAQGGYKSPKKLIKSVVKKVKPTELLKFIRKGMQYTQIELQQITKIPYRSVRRYINELVKSGALIASGYGKGRRFSRK